MLHVDAPNLLRLAQAKRKLRSLIGQHPHPAPADDSRQERAPEKIFFAPP